MRRILARLLVFLVPVVFAIRGWADEQEKAVKEVKKIASISVDSSMRSIVNRTMAEALKMGRLDLVKERQETNLNYGGLFLAHQLVASGGKMEDITAQLKLGKTIFDIANESRTNWKQVGSDAKKLNKKIDDNIVKYFQDSKRQIKVDQADNYDAKADSVAADSGVTKEEYADAQSRFQRLHDMASSSLPTGDANVRSQGQGNPTPTIGAPVTGR
jgi:hypothetical protein